MPRKHPTRATSAFREAGWSGTTFHGKPAYRGPNGWVAQRVPGEGLVLYRDDHYMTCYFATYRTPAELLADASASMKNDRTRKGEDRPTRSHIPTVGAWVRHGEAVKESDRWAPHDPRWG